MRSKLFILILPAAFAVAARPAQAERPDEARKSADYVIFGTVQAVYVQDTKAYRKYIVEIKVQGVEKGTRLKKGDTFRAFCYQRKKGFGGEGEYDAAGHTAVPRLRQRIKAFVKDGRGYNEGIYPNWFDVIKGTGK
jgi:hypothetical protein